MPGNIYFTQYLRPNGEKKAVMIERPDDVVTKADAITRAGFRFECEELTTGDVSFTVSDDHGDYDHAICLNGGEVPKTVDKLILNFDVAAGISARARNRN